MARTMYNTPILRPIASTLCKWVLKLRGWKLEGLPPSEPKYVLIAVPHTSNWDFPLALSMAFVYPFEMYWVGKSALFKGWRGPIMRWLGGIPVDRSAKNNTVSQTIETFKQSERLALALSPEGTRSRVDTWKTGFYYIAHGANVPIALAFLDYERKAGGFLDTFYPTGDIDKDIPEIKARYSKISGKFADKFSL